MPLVEPDELLREVGNTIRRLRAARGFSQEAFAQEAKLDRAYMGGVERGQRNVGVVNLYRIARALNMSLSELFAEMEGRKGRSGD
jgi:transcriptional regulator with XRE-family HTH domain